MIPDRYTKMRVSKDELSYGLTLVTMNFAEHFMAPFLERYKPDQKETRKNLLEEGEFFLGTIASPAFRYIEAIIAAEEGGDLHDIDKLQGPVEFASNCSGLLESHMIKPALAHLGKSFAEDHPLGSPDCYILIHPAQVYMGGSDTLGTILNILNVVLVNESLLVVMSFDQEGQPLFTCGKATFSCDPADVVSGEVREELGKDGEGPIYAIAHWHPIADVPSLYSMSADSIFGHVVNEAKKRCRKDNNKG